MRCVPSPRRIRRFALCVTLVAAAAAAALVPTAGLSAVTGTTTPCGATIYKSAGVPWKCTFAEDFNGTALDRRKWTVQATNQFGFHSGNECMVDSPSTISVSGGHLNLTVVKTAKPFTCASPQGNFTTSYAGGSIYSKAFSQRLGRFEFRAKFAESNNHAGVQGALWLFTSSMPGTTRLLSGPREIDVAEAYSVHPDYVIPTVHTYRSLLRDYYAPCKVPDFGAAYHTYAVEWAAKVITFYYDNTQCFRIVTTTSSGVSPFLVALSQAMGVKPNLPTASTPLPARMQVDYVRVWA